MRALTLHQPWAELVASGRKGIETRTWPAPRSIIGERIAIHAGAKAARPDGAGRAWNLVGISHDDLVATCWPNRNISADPLPLGAVVATALLVECIPAAGVYAVDDWEQMDPAQDGIDPARQRWAWDVAPGTTVEMMGAPIDVDPSVLCHPAEALVGNLEGDRWAWLLDEVERLPEPVPAKGHQRLWWWNEGANGAA